MKNEQVDGNLQTGPIYSFRNEVADAEETSRVAEQTVIVETTVVEDDLEDDLKTEEVIVNQAPSTEQAEMETQELVVVFDDDDDMVDVLTNIT